MTQAAALRAELDARGHALRVRAVEGDSRNGTVGYLRAHAAASGLSLDLATHNHGGPWFGSTEAPERMLALSGVANAVLDGVSAEDDALVYVESDLLWAPSVMTNLLAQLGPGRDVIAPLVFAGEAFYDIWGFRASGQRFGPFPPYYEGLRLDEPTEVESVGSCLVMRGDVARSVRMESGALVEFCANARRAGFRVYCDARERIHHP
jgi:hypothetical protein